MFFLLLREKNPNAVVKLCQEFHKAKSEWLCQLKTDAFLLESNKETVILYKKFQVYI